LNKDLKKPLIERVLEGRKLENISVSLDDLHDPFLLKDCQKAVERIQEAIKKKERVMIYGDYDVDGITSANLLYQVLRSLGAEVSVRLPHRVNDGYGLNEKFIKECQNLKVALIITVDCGVSNKPEIEQANTAGIDVIITDHHSPPPELPNALAILNPKQEDCEYPNKEIVGVGVAFKFAQALFKTFEKPSDEVYQYLDLVALGTVADCAQIVGENRVFVKCGLDRLKNTINPGLRSLMQASKVDTNNLSTYTLGFILSPRLNAAGRLEDPLFAFNLLNGQLQNSAFLDKINVKRQELVRTFLKEAEELLGEVKTSQKILIVGSDQWHVGVIGLIAGRLCEKYNRPAIAITKLGDQYVGSARSIGEFNVIETLRKFDDLFTHYGGHKGAAGFSVPLCNVKNLTQGLEKEAKKALKGVKLTAKIQIDTEILPQEITWENLEALEKLEPFGLGNPQPRFLLRNVKISDLRLLGKEKTHLGFGLDLENQPLRAIAFRFGEHYRKLREHRSLDLVFSLEKNTWKGNTNMQAKIEDIAVKR